MIQRESTAAPRMSIRHGFTLVEVLMVVTVIGIASAIVVPSMIDAGTLGVQAATRAVIADVLYAQNAAVAHQGRRRVVFEPAADRYQLTDDQGKVIESSWRTGGGPQYTVDFQADQRFDDVDLVRANFGGDAVLEFDALGSPRSGGELVLEHHEQRYLVKVAPFTGRVTVKKVE